MGRTVTETVTGQETWVRQTQARRRVSQSQARDMGETVTETIIGQETWVGQSQARRHGWDSHRSGEMGSHKDSHRLGDMGETVRETDTGPETWEKQSQTRDMGGTVTGQET